MRLRLIVAFVTSVAMVHAAAYADTVAQEDFDGGAINLSSSAVPALDGGPGDYFGVGSRNAWPQGTPPGVPFSLADDSVISYSDPANPPNPDDVEGVYGENSDFDNNYFALSDSDEFGLDQTASWTFNISGFTDLSMSIDMGGISGPSFGGYNADETDLLFTAQIDGGAVQTVFDLNVVVVDPAVGPPFLTRLMDIGTQSGGGNLLEATGDNAVTKILADTGAAAGDLFLDKTPPSGSGAGQLDAFTTALNGSGSELVLTFTANMPFEGMVFDNIRIEGVPEPASVTLLGLAGALLLMRRRR